MMVEVATGGDSASGEQVKNLLMYQNQSVSQ